MSFEEVQLWIAEGKRDGWDYLLHGYDYSTKEYFHVYASVADLGTVVKKYDQNPYRLDETIPISEAVIKELQSSYRQQRERSIAEGQRNGSDYMFVIHDSFSHDEYTDYSSIADFDLIREKYSHQDTDMQWISQIIPISPAAVDHQKSFLVDKDPEVRRDAASRLSSAHAINLDVTGAVPELVKLLSDPDPKVRETAAWGSFYWLRDTVYVATAVPALEALLNDESETVRQRAERALGAIRSKRA